jgi:hypothetical protein
MAPSLSWNASARHRRWILKQYDRGPRKKPPDRPPPRPNKSTGFQRGPTKQRHLRRTLRHITYKRYQQAAPNTQYKTRAPAPFLAGRRQIFNRFSPHYWRITKASILRNHRHGCIRQLFGKISHESSYLTQQITQTFSKIGENFKSIFSRLIQSPILKALWQLHPQLRHPITDSQHSHPLSFFAQGQAHPCL